jgi:hypothetical protein
MRYTIELDAYVYADTDEEARELAARLAQKLREGDDNDARVLTIHETPHGTLNARPVNVEEI